jgi:uncharacterized protein YecT (DUF1311 family)
MRLHFVYVALATFFLTSPAPATQPKPKDYRSEYDKCVKNAIGSGVGSNASLEACTESVTDEAKHEMNMLYKNIHDGLQSKSPSDAIEFEKAQRAWLEYRNAHCDLAQKLIGTPETVICPMDLNIGRVNELRRLSNSP